MFDVLAEGQVIATNGAQVFEAPFSLSGQVMAKFAPNVGARVLRGETTELTLQNIENSGFFELELPLDLARIGGADQVFARIDIAAAASMVVAAAVRLDLPRGAAEVSSPQVELRGAGGVQLLAVPLTDFAAQDLALARGASLVLSFEPRDVTMIVRAFDAVIFSPERLLAHAERRLGAWGVWHSGPFRGHHSLGRGVKLDIEQGKQHSVTMRRKGRTRLLDFSGAAGAAWRTLEFRFKRVRNTGALGALIEFDGCASAGDVAVPLTLRHYTGGTPAWRDSRALGSLSISQTPQKRQVIVPISPSLGTPGGREKFGLMAFLPPDAGEISIRSMRVRIVSLA